jgi:hypothetical protein
MRGLRSGLAFVLAVGFVSAACSGGSKSGDTASERGVRTEETQVAGPELVARHLSVPMHSPTLVHTFLLRDRSERPVEWVRIHVLPDRPTPVEVFDLTTGAWTLSEAP